MADNAKSSIVGAILWMFIISILLFWFPMARLLGQDLSVG